MEPCDLILVMPVYNEESCIGLVVEEWYATLTRLGIDFRIIILNDGSTDRTTQALSRYAGHPHIRVIDKANSGHGPTILEGYRMAAPYANWVFQVDSDDEMPPDGFATLWQQREGVAIAFGSRQNRRQNLGRRIISAVSRLSVRIMFGEGVVDVNTPYRLMNSRVLMTIIRHIPDDTFAPNIMISGAIAASGLGVLSLPVAHVGRRTGAVSIVKWRLWKSSVRAFVQTVLFRMRCLSRIRRELAALHGGAGS